MLHLTKLAVGVRDADHLRELQAVRMRDHPPLRHRTRNFPRRRLEVIDGGSMYWVIAALVVVLGSAAVAVLLTRSDDNEGPRLVPTTTVSPVVRLVETVIFTALERRATVGLERQ